MNDEPLRHWCLVALCLGPLAWMLRFPRRSAEAFDGGDGTIAKAPSADASVAWFLATAVGLLSFDMTYLASLEVGELPPAIHDEYSYLFQAQTFLAGRFWFPSHPHAPLFDQIHVLNEGKFASRYFPGTGLWLAPSVAIGRPHVGHWLAGAVSCMLVFGCARELAGNRAGLAAGLVMALSPGLAFFSNLLVAHSPTLLGLTLFCFAVLRLRRARHATWAVLAGAGLSGAMLCRPLTAAAVGAPFGGWFLWWVWRLRRTEVDAAKLVIGMAVPLLLGLTFLGAHNRSITGSCWKTPYQLYNDVYTPNHVYGFNNVVRGQARVGPRVDADYNNWATNLEWPDALKNAKQRLWASLDGILGTVPLMTSLLILVCSVRAFDRFVWLFPAAIALLHLAHVPYWFTGLKEWHYVFESLALWAVLFGVATECVAVRGVRGGRFLLPCWWAVLVGLTLAENFLPLGPSHTSRFQAAATTFSHMRVRHASFLKLVDECVLQRPAVVMVPDPPLSMHLDYVINHPSLKSEVLFARSRTPADLATDFPGRTVYQFHERKWEITKLR